MGEATGWACERLTCPGFSTLENHSDYRLSLASVSSEEARLEPCS